MAQVKECLMAAQQGDKWHPAGFEDYGSSGVGSGSGTHSGAVASGPGSPASGSSINGSSGTDHINDGSGGGGDSGGEAKAAVDGSAGGGSRAPALISGSAGGRVTLFGALLAWVGIVGMFLSILPRLHHRVKRRSSTAEASAKLNV